MEYEYGIFVSREGELHRGPMTEQAAHEWIEEWLDDGGKPDVFFIMRREVGNWTVPKGE